ncbi:hypothetical protein EC988_010425 [Linderina pennispora]|nr:hypothetical protein EC988_010425 [Linderina pennispora]
MDLFCGTLPKFANVQFERLPYEFAQQQNYAQRSERRHMSYPGPSGVYYNSSCAYQTPQYCNVQSVAKHADSYASQNQHPSSGSTLASSSPGDTAAIAAYQQGVV